MSYIKVSWPESQALMYLTDDDMEDYGIELGEDCSYFVPEEDYDEIFELAEIREAEEDGDEPDASKNELPWSYGKHFD